MSITRESFLYRGALVIGVLPGLLSGINPVFRPGTAYQGTGFPVPEDLESRKTVEALVRVIGIRNIVISSVFALNWYTGNKKAVALNLLGFVFICVTDGFVSKALTGGGEWKHWGFAPVFAGFAAGLLGWIG